MFNHIGFLYQAFKSEKAWGSWHKVNKVVPISSLPLWPLAPAGLTNQRAGCADTNQSAPDLSKNQPISGDGLGRLPSARSRSCLVGSWRDCGRGRSLAAHQRITPLFSQLEDWVRPPPPCMNSLTSPGTFFSARSYRPILFQSSRPIDREGPLRIPRFWKVLVAWCWRLRRNWIRCVR